MSDKMPALSEGRYDAEWPQGARDIGPSESGTDLLLDGVVHRAALLFNVPIAVVSLHDGTRQLVRSSIGLGLPFSSSDLAFCGDALLAEKPIFLLNARFDSRFAGNAVIEGKPGIGFYASTPVYGPDRRRLGALCAMDRRARDVVSTEELASFERLALQVSLIMANTAREVKPERGW